jgi:6-phosphogluconolactonase
MAEPVLIVCKDPDALATRAADVIIRSAQEAVRRRGRFTLVLSGGSTPEKTYSMLAQPALGADIDWSKTYLFFGDERFVPPDDVRSNYATARRSLLDRVAINDSNVFPVPTWGKSAAECAAAYDDDLAGFFATIRNGAPPRFDLILLGMAEDGHTASLFPDSPALEVEDAWVAWTPPGALPPPVERITLTYPVLNAAREVLFLVAGAKKAAALRDVLEGDAPRVQRPAAGVKPTDGSLTWIVDEGAAMLLAPRYCTQGHPVYAGYQSCIFSRNEHSGSGI